MKPAFPTSRQISGIERQGMRTNNAYGCVCARNPGIIRRVLALMI